MSKTVKDFYDYEAMSLGCSTDGPLPEGELRVYKTSKGMLSRVQRANMASERLTKKHIVIFGTYYDDPVSEADVSTLKINKMIKYISYPNHLLEQGKTAKPVQIIVTSKPGQNQIISKSENAVAEASGLVVSDLASYEQAGEIIRELKKMAKEVGATFDPMIEKAHQSHKEALAQKAKFIKPLEDAEKQLKSQMGAWYQNEQARIATERRAAEEARRREMEEARKLEEVAADKAMAERQIEIEAALAEGDEEKAQEIGSAPLIMAAPASPVIPVFEKFEAPKVAGVSTRKKYRAVVVDFAALVVAAATDKNLVGYLQANQSALDSIAMATKGNAVIPGVTIHEDIIMGVRG